MCTLYHKLVLLTMENKMDICPACNGSGEGNYSGSVCSKCKGSGELPEKETERDYEDE